jgi:archaellum component FlaC
MSYTYDIKHPKLPRQWRQESDPEEGATGANPTEDEERLEEMQIDIDKMKDHLESIEFRLDQFRKSIEQLQELNSRVDMLWNKIDRMELKRGWI